MAVVTWAGALVWVASQIGLGGVFRGVAASVVITSAVVGAVWWLGRWVRGRPSLLVSGFVWGASVAAFCAIWSQQWLQELVDWAWGADVGAWVRPLLITPVTEELLKGMFLAWLLLFRRREITGVLDGVVYAALIGAGFSFTENSLYLGRALAAALAGTVDGSAVSTLAVTLVLRAVLVPFFHPLMVALTGIGVGIGANSLDRRSRWLPVAGGVLAAIILHGIWDWAGLASSDSFLLFKIYGSVMVPVFLGVFILSILLRSRTGRMVSVAAQTWVQDGSIASAEAEVLSSLRARRIERVGTWRRSGRQAAQAIGRYQAEASALAVRSVRGRPGDRQLLAEQQRIAAELRKIASQTGSSRL